jgi:hypothetical protein
VTLLISYYNSTHIEHDDRISIIGIYTVLDVFLAAVIKFKLSGQPLLNSIKSDEKGVSVPGSDELAVISNIATFIGYILSILLTILINPSKHSSFILLSSIFLLLNRDSGLFKDFLEPMRYVAILISAQVSLIVLFLKDLFYSFFDFGKMKYVVYWNILLFIFSLPSNYLFCKFLFYLKRPKESNIYLNLPLIILGLLFYNYDSIFWLAFIGFIGNILQLFTATQWSRQVSFPI